MAWNGFLPVSIRSSCGVSATTSPAKTVLGPAADGLGERGRTQHRREQVEPGDVEGVRRTESGEGHGGRPGLPGANHAHEVGDRRGLHDGAVAGHGEPARAEDAHVDELRPRVNRDRQTRGVLDVEGHVGGARVGDRARAPGARRQRLPRLDGGGRGAGARGRLGDQEDARGELLDRGEPAPDGHHDERRLEHLGLARRKAEARRHAGPGGDLFVSRQNKRGSNAST